MTKLIITRTSEWNNKAREFGIYLNDKKIGVIDDGEKKEFEIEPGVYKVNGKIDWCKSPKIEFNIKDNESKEIEISGFKYGNIIMPIGLGIVLFFFLIKLIFKIESNFLIILGGIGFLYPLYYITIGKNKYLSIREKIN